MDTVADPFCMLSGGPAQVHILPTVAAGCPPIITLGTPGGNMGPPVCGLPLGLVNGQVWLSVILAAAAIVLLIDVYHGSFDYYVAAAGLYADAAGIHFNTVLVFVVYFQAAAGRI